MLPILMDQLWWLWLVPLALVLRILVVRHAPSGKRGRRTGTSRSWRRRSDAAKQRGKEGEAQVADLLHRVFPAPEHRSLHDVTLPWPSTGRGGAADTVQIDHILLSPFGLFVLETKNMAGRILGRPDRKNWTQRFPGVLRGYRFQNPLKQNAAHVEALLARLTARLSDPGQAAALRRHTHAYIVFTGEARLEVKPRPAQVVTVAELRRALQRHQAPSGSRYLSTKAVQGIARVLEQMRLPPGAETEAAHIAGIRRRRRLRWRGRK